MRVHNGFKPGQLLCALRETMTVGFVVINERTLIFGYAEYCVEHLTKQAYQPFLYDAL